MARVRKQTAKSNVPQAKPAAVPARNFDLEASEIVSDALDAFHLGSPDRKYSGYGGRPPYQGEAKKSFHQLLFNSTRRNLVTGQLEWNAQTKKNVLAAAGRHGELAKAEQGKAKTLTLQMILDSLDEARAEGMCPVGVVKLLGAVCDF